MTIARTTAPRRRPAPPVDRYRAVARATRRKRARRRLPPILTGLIWGVVLASAALVADTAFLAVGYATGSFGNFVTNLIPDAVPADLTVTETTGQVNAAPLLDATPQFTKTSALVVQGIIPSFGRAADRKVSIALNGGAAVLVPYDANGHFALPVTLADGTNQLFIALVSPTDTIALTSVTVVLDTVAPPLTLSKPVNGDKIDGTNLTVEGKAEPGATVLVNDRSVIVGQDGSFTDTVTVPAGTLPLTVIARDRAGNETKTELTVTMNGKPILGAAAIVSVTLANGSVKPGGYVGANITVTNLGKPVVGQRVSLQVGVVAIGTAVTDAAGKAFISFAAPPNEGIAQVVVLAGNASGSAILTIAK
ncbi:MAG TPA: hypothetical protein VLI88_08030 [Patescibacteria group bacterium]|nr:hypothetical protein [Patescibacteria group bacterium]